jgi:pimeloyl-ACP methyl ester carboxylesterase
VHGATFPSALSIAHRFDCCGAKPRSWRDALCDSGFHVWGLDFLGFGQSDRYPGMADRYPEMTKPAETMPPLCRAEDAAEQIAAAARFILQQHEARHLSIIAHSWGTIAACRFASLHPASIGRLVLFGPIARRDLPQEEPLPKSPAWRLITLEAQWTRFVEDVPAREQPVLSRAHFGPWGEAYLDSDPGSRERDPAGVKVPAGPAADIARAWHGDLPYDPAEVTAPVAIIRGAWDGVCTDEDARWLFDRFGSAVKQDVKIGRGTHLMHLEAMRHALYRASIAFLLDDNS